MIPDTEFCEFCNHYSLRTAGSKSSKAKGVCKRYPTETEHTADDWCGEFAADTSKRRAAERTYEERRQAQLKADRKAARV